MVLEGEILAGQPLFEVSRDLAHAPALHAGDDVQAPGDRISVNDRRGLDRTYVGHVAEPEVPAAGAVDQQILDVLHAAPGLRRALDDDVEDLLLFEDTADLDALQQGGLGPAHQPGADTELLGLLQVHLDLDGGLQTAARESAAQRAHPRPT